MKPNEIAAARISVPTQGTGGGFTITRRAGRAQAIGPVAAKLIRDAIRRRMEDQRGNGGDRHGEADGKQPPHHLMFQGH